MTEREPLTDTGDSIDELGPEQGGGPPAALPWTLVVEGDEPWSADLEHGAPLPSLDDTIEYIAEDGARRIYRVTRIVHTLQRSASERPSVDAEESGPNSLVNDRPVEGPPRALRAGLPRVFVTPEE
jgi:hypothetical protein